MKKIFQWVIVILFLIVFVFLLNIGENISIKEVQPVLQIENKNVLESENINYIKIGEKLVKVELALTNEQKQKGLSGRKELKKDEGMLFIFENEGIYPFWMKDMLFPIDIIFISEDFEVVYIKKEAKPDSFPEMFSSEKPARYVLEVLSGFSEENNLKEGDKVKFLP